jgi:hypothetical protein
MVGEMNIMARGKISTYNTPSGASDFVCFANTNGNDEWKNHNGVKLKDL